MQMCKFSKHMHIEYELIHFDNRFAADNSQLHYACMYIVLLQ